MTDVTKEMMARAADVAERFYLADFGGNDVAALRIGVCGDSAIQDFVVQVEAIRQAALATHAAQIEALRAERDFLLARAVHAGSCSFAPGRWTGVSSNALVTVAFGGKADELPFDTHDLAACYRTMMRLPRHLLSEKVWRLLEAGEEYVARSYDIAKAKKAADWPENARAALGEPTDGR